MKITYQELDEVLKILKFQKMVENSTLIYSYPPLDAKIKFSLPSSEKELVHEGIIHAHAFILQEKGMISQADVLFQLIQNQRFVKENVLV